jgi:DNA (cytosine-5)-methyltransferase 1
MRGTEVQVVDFFSGCGGMSYGFATAQPDGVSYRVKGALDIDVHANATYERMVGVKPIPADIRKYLEPGGVDALVEAWGINREMPLVVIGCAPCQGFSSHRKKDPRKDVRNTLIGAFADIAAALRPDVVIMENVPELFDRRHWPHFKYWRDRLQAEGYAVRAQIRNFAEFGVPQERFRVLAIAVMGHPDFPMPPVLRDAPAFATVRDAIGTLPPVDAGGQDRDDPMHQASNHRKQTVELIKQVPLDGGSRRDLPDGVGLACHDQVDGFRDVYGRLSWDEPSVSITARCRTPSCGRYVHPEQNRGLTVREAALLQGFPQEFVFEGPFDDKFKQIGNAVSPMVSRMLAEHLAPVLKEEAGQLKRDGSRDIEKPMTKSFSSRIAALKRRMREAGFDTTMLAPELT